jgi:hypothetical protein
VRRCLLLQALWLQQLQVGGAALPVACAAQPGGRPHKQRLVACACGGLR